MIKLTEIVKEISFPHGHASSSGLEDISSDALYQNNIDSDLDRPEDYDELKLPIKDKRFQASIKKRLEVISEQNGYVLMKIKKTKYDGEIAYYLTNPRARVIGDYFVGVIKTQPTFNRRYNMKKGFEVDLEVVHWSNVALQLRGSGIGKLMYTMVYEYITSQGKSFGSDSTLFEGSAGMWMQYMPSIADYFGVVIEDIIVPLSKEELTKKNKSAFEGYGIDGFVAMNNPPTMVRKIEHNLKGLSYIKGEYGIVRMMGDVNDDDIGIKGEDTFIDYVKEFSDMKSLLRGLRYDIGDITGNRKTKYKTLLFAFYDAIVVVKELPNGLSTIVI